MRRKQLKYFNFWINYFIFFHYIIFTFVIIKNTLTFYLELGKTEVKIGHTGSEFIGHPLFAPVKNYWWHTRSSPSFITDSCAWEPSAHSTLLLLLTRKPLLLLLSPRILPFPSRPIGVYFLVQHLTRALAAKLLLTAHGFGCLFPTKKSTFGVSISSSALFTLSH